MRKKSNKAMAAVATDITTEKTIEVQEEVQSEKWI